MTTIGFDLRVLGSRSHSGIQEYTERLFEHIVPLDRSIRWCVFRGAVSNRGLWLATRLIGRPYLDRLVGGADLFFFPHFLLGATSSRCKRVMTWHDLSYERMPELFSWRRRVWHQLQMRPRRQAEGADHIIAVSRSTADDLVRLYDIEVSRISMIPSGVDPLLHRASNGEINAYRCRTDLFGRYILALGTREPRKNLDTLVRAFDQIAGKPGYADLVLVIAGPPGWLEQEFMRAIAQSPHQTRIRCIGPIAREDRAALVSGASVLAYPSLMEGFGFPVLEAMACGTPVVAGATSALFETVSDAGFLVDPYSIDMLAGVLEAVITDTLLQRRLVAAGYAHAGRYSWAKTAEATLEAILSVLQ